MCTLAIKSERTDGWYSCCLVLQKGTVTSWSIAGPSSSSHEEMQQEEPFLCPRKSGARAACLSQCLRGDGQNADESISMPGGKPHMPRLCPLAAGVEGFLHKATGSGMEPGSILHLWTFRQKLQGDCNSITVVTCQWLRVIYNQRQCFYGLDQSPCHKFPKIVILIFTKN